MARKGTKSPALDRNGHPIDCVSQTLTAFEIQVCVNGQRKSKRAPLTKTPSELEALRDDMKSELRNKQKQRAVSAPVAGTLDAGARAFVAAWTGVNRKQITQRMQLWVDALGPRTTLDSITKQQISAQVATWGSDDCKQANGKRGAYSVETRRKLQRVLRQMFDMLGGANPARQVKMLSKPKPEPRALDFELAKRIVDDMDASVTRARLKVMLHLGATQTEQMRMQRIHMDTRRGRLTLLARRKGEGGAEARVLPYGLMDDARAALDELASFDVWGETFALSTLQRAFSLAAAKHDVYHVRPYDLRHTCATELYRRTGNIRTVQKWLGHSNVETTTRYILGGDDDALTAAAAAMQSAATKRKQDDAAAATTQKRAAS